MVYSMIIILQLRSCNINEIKNEKTFFLISQNQNFVLEANIKSSKKLMFKTSQCTHKEAIQTRIYSRTICSRNIFNRTILILLSNEKKMSFRTEQ